VRLSGASDAGSELAQGDDAFEAGDLARAEVHYRAAKGNASTAMAAEVGLARVRIARSGVTLDFGAAKGNRDVAAAELALSRLVKSSPAGAPFGPAFVELGRARLLLGDAGGAIDSLKRGVELLPSEPEARSQLGIAYLATGHPDDAVKELARAAALDSTNPARHGNLGTALMMAGRTQEAVEQYRERVRLDDGDARAHSDLGTALLGTQDLPGALSELERAVQIDPRRPALHSNLGYAFQQSGRIDRAVAEYREALRLDPAFASAWINLATALAHDPKSRGDARAALERARALSPDDPRVKANLEELDALEKRLTSPNAIP
jgi:Flp pilus assembly protein TadD